MQVEVLVDEMTESDGVVYSSEDDTRGDINNTSCSYQPSDHQTDYVNTGYQKSTAGNITDSEDYLKPTNSVAKK